LLPFFYIEDASSKTDIIVLDEDNSKHVVSVLRMKTGDQLHLTDGKGLLLTTAITDDHKKRCTVKIIQSNLTEPAARNTTIAISLIKNSTRFEWFLEKATEIGITEIVPLLCERTERQHFRYQRMNAVLISAMLQSQQCWLPVLQEPVSYVDFIGQSDQGQIRLSDQKFIAHCIETEKKELATLINPLSAARVILIGPEGDFTNNEINLAIDYGFVPAALGANRLRTETAGIVAAVILRISV
jgi:16S rRNA (uracil1498-N3)-methyltransferase